MTARARNGNTTLLLAAALVAFAARVYRLDAQSLWNDEGTSVALARLSLPAIAGGAAHDIHPPLYYFLLHFWMGAAGDGEFAVRFLSVAAGVLLVAVTARLARSLFGVSIAIVAAFLSTLSAFELYYSQETRMYIWVALFSAVSFYALIRLLGRVQRGGSRAAFAFDLALYILATVAALYTHYFAPAILLAQNFAVLVWLILRWRDRPSAARPRLLRLLAGWAGAQIIIALAFLPWLAYAGNQLSAWPAISEPLSAVDLALRVLAAFTLGIDSPLGSQWLPVALFGLLFLLGLSYPLVHRRAGNRGVSFSVLVCALWAIVPLAFMYVVSLQRPAYNPKFLLLSTPAFLILAACGAGAVFSIVNRQLSPLARPVQALGALVLLAAAAFSASGIYTDSRLQRDDYRGVLGYINTYAQEQDAVVVDAPGQIDVVRYYYRGAAPLITLPVGRPLNRPATDGALDEMLRGRNEIFAVYWATEQADPEHYVEQVLATNRFQASDEWHGNIRLAQYGAGGLEASLLTKGPVRFGDELVLGGVHRIGSGPVQAGRVLSLDFGWNVLSRPAGNYKVFVHLLDSAGQIASQRDAEPAAGFRPTSSWFTGETITDRLGLLIRPGVAAGEYTLVMGLYRPESGSRLPVSSGGDMVELGQVAVAP